MRVYLEVRVVGLHSGAVGGAVGLMEWSLGRGEVEGGRFLVGCWGVNDGEYGSGFKDLMRGRDGCREGCGRRSGVSCLDVYLRRCDGEKEWRSGCSGERRRREGHGVREDSIK